MTYETLKDHPLIDATTIGLKGSPTNILTSFTPPQKGAGMMLEGRRQGDHRQAGRHPGRRTSSKINHKKCRHFCEHFGRLRAHLLAERNFSDAHVAGKMIARTRIETFGAVYR